MDRDHRTTRSHSDPGFFPTAERGVDLAPADPDPEAPSTGRSRGNELAQAFAGNFDGTEVSILSTWADPDGDKFLDALASFEAETGITIEHTGARDFQSLINVQIASGDAPDIAMFPQPRLLASFVESGDALDLSPFISVDDLRRHYAEDWIDLGTFGGKLSGVFYRASIKSLVWYPVEEWNAAGYNVPETWDELTALSDQMVADGAAPWCISIESGAATGWVATDWLEDILLRTAPVDIYDQWVAHEIPFNHPEVLEAAGIMEDIWFNEDYVYGGLSGILSTNFTDSAIPMFADGGPDCWMHRQAGFFISFLPAGKQEFGVDVDFFYLPPIEEVFGRPVLGFGEQAGAFNDRPEVRAVMQYLATPEAAEGWVAAGGFISPNSGVSLNDYANDADRNQAEILQDATTVRFDASDMMPADVGAGTFWSGMVDWVEGSSAEDVFAAIESNWPTR